MTGKRLGMVFLLIQVGLLAYARVQPAKWFCWAPYDEHVRFSISVWIDGRPLPAAAAGRYRFEHPSIERRSLGNLQDKIVQYETTYGRQDRAIVRLTYSVNGRPIEDWWWDQDGGAR